MLRPIEDNERLTLHGHIALDDVHVAGECGHLVLVLHFKRGGIDLDRLILVLVLKNALRRGTLSLRRGILRQMSLRKGATRRRHRSHQRVQPKPMRH